MQDVYERSRERAEQRTQALLLPELQRVFADIRQAQRERYSKDEAALPQHDPAKPLDLLNWQSQDIRTLIRTGEWLGQQLDDLTDEWEWLEEHQFCKMVSYSSDIGIVNFPREWCYEDLLHIGCRAFDTPVGRIASLHYLFSKLEYRQYPDFDQIFDYLNLQIGMDALYASSRTTRTQRRPFFEDQVTLLYLAQLTLPRGLNELPHADEYGVAGAVEPHHLLDLVGELLSYFLATLPPDTLIHQVFYVWWQAVEWQTAVVCWYDADRWRSGSSGCWINVLHSKDYKALQAYGISVPCPAFFEGASPVAVAWDVADRERFAVWWIKAEDELFRESAILQCYRLLSKDLPWGTASMERSHIVSVQPLSPNPESNRFRMHLFGDHLRLVHQGGILDLGPHELQTQQEVEEVDQVELDALSGELRRAGEQRSQRDFYYRDFCVSEGHLLLQYYPDPEWEPPVSTSFAERQSAHRQVAVPVSNGPKRVPAWAQQIPLPLPLASSAGSAQEFDEKDLFYELWLRGWEFDATVTASWQFAYARVTAQILTRPEGTVVLLSAQRDCWIIRQNVRLQGDVEEAAIASLMALDNLALRVLETPPAEPEVDSFTPTLFLLSLEELMQLSQAVNEEQAALPATVLWIRVYAVARAMQLSLPAPPDWNILRHLWHEKQMPGWAFAQVWDALPDELRNELKL